MTKSASIESERILWNGRFPLSRIAANVVEDDGTRRSLDFEVYRHGPAAAALPYDAERGCVLLVRQFRLGALLANGATDVLEAPAGMLDGDAPAVCARRELLEETGVKAEALEELLRRQQDLVGGLSTSALAAHAVRQHSHQAPGHAIVLQDTDLVLLVRSVASMQSGGGGQAVTDARCAHAENYNRFAFGANAQYRTKATRSWTSTCIRCRASSSS